MQESNPNDFSNEHGLSVGGYDPANGSSAALAIHDSLPVEPDSQVQPKKGRKGKKKKKKGQSAPDDGQDESSSLAAN